MLCSLPAAAVIQRERVSEILVFDLTLMCLIGWEDFSAFVRRNLPGNKIKVHVVIEGTRQGP